MEKLSFVDNFIWTVLELICNHSCLFLSLYGLADFEGIVSEYTVKYRLENDALNNWYAILHWLIIELLEIN